MHIIAVWLLVVTAGVAVGLTVLCFVFTRCCTKRRLRDKIRPPQPPPRETRKLDPKPRAPRPDFYLDPISIQSSPNRKPPMVRLNSPRQPQNVEKEDSTTSLQDYEYVSNGLGCQPPTPTLSASQELLPSSPPVMYEVPRSQTPSCNNTLRPPITIKTQGQSITLKYSNNSNKSYPCEEIPTISIYSTLSSLFPLTKKIGLHALEAGEGTSTKNHVQSLPRPGKQHNENRLTMAEMELDNNLHVKFKVKTDE